MFKRIDHVAIHVTDLDRSVAFYEEHFGFKKYFQHAATGERAHTNLLLVGG